MQILPYKKQLCADCKHFIVNVHAKPARKTSLATGVDAPERDEIPDRDEEDENRSPRPSRGACTMPMGPSLICLIILSVHS